MAFYRGQDGYMALGGLLAGTPRSQALVTAASTSFTIDSAGTLYGTVVAGDRFTVAGETGSPVHTVTGGPFYTTSANAVGPITFTPAAASGGWASHAAVTFQSNSVAQVVSWQLQTQQDLLDADVMGVSWKQYVGGLAGWTGNMQVRLDLSDPIQDSLANDIFQAVPTATVVGITFGIFVSQTLPSIRQFYGGAVLRNLSIANQLNQLATMTCDFTGNGAGLALDWQPNP